MKKVAGALDPPPPPPVHAVMHPGGAGDGGLKTVTFAVKFVVPAFTRRSEVTVAWSVEEVAPARIASFFCAPAKLQFTWEPPEGSVEGRKPEPLSIKVSEAVPAGALAGLMPVRPGKGFGGGLITKAKGFESPLFPAPVAGFKVMMVATPDLAMSAAGTVAVTTFPSAAPVMSTGTVVVRVLPFHWTTVFRTKPLPFTVKVKSPQLALQALIWAGERKESAAPVLF